MSVPWSNAGAATDAPVVRPGGSTIPAPTQDSPFPPIADYGFLSDCHTGALVASDGAIEWMCLPHFDSASVFAAMLDRGAGKVVFTASVLSFQGGVNVPGYTASKSGLVGLMKAFANEWAGQGINVNAIAPGYIRTDNTQPLQDDPDRSAGILARIPAGRWGTPDDLVGAIIFLSASASDYVHGAVLPVDGGWLAR